VSASPDRPFDTVAESAVNPSEASIAPTTDTAPFTFTKRFHVPLSERKYLIQSFIPGQPVLGFTGGVINWRYNDSGRGASIGGAATAADTIATIQAQQAKWSAVCNITFNYVGTTTATPAIAFNGGGTDGVNTIGWTVQVGNQTGVTGISGTGTSNAGPFTIVESDMALNSAFNPQFDVTVLHELGHMLGLDHSNVSQTVMSGPPLTAYFATSTLTPDDIAGCQAMYGTPTSTARTISGTITNGASAVSGLTFCTNGAGATCAVTNAFTGAYSCSVPSGWSGSIHPRASGARIPAQTFANVTANTLRNISAQSNSSFSTCNLDIDNNGLLEPAIDGVAIMRRLSGVSQTSLPALAGVCAQSSSAAHSFATLNSFNFNATGGVGALPTTDGLIIIRAMNGLGAASITGAVEAGAARTTWSSIQSALNGTCGTNF
jgi:hypothetical protein